MSEKTPLTAQQVYDQSLAFQNTFATKVNDYVFGGGNTDILQGIYNYELFSWFMWLCVWGLVILVGVAMACVGGYGMRQAYQNHNKPSTGTSALFGVGLGIAVIFSFFNTIPLLKIIEMKTSPKMWMAEHLQAPTKMPKAQKEEY